MSKELLMGHPLASKEHATHALTFMWKIRKFEEAVEDLFGRGMMHGTMHLSIGQEASPTGVCMALGLTDQITSTHRGHGHCIAKGADLTRMIAELLGKEIGYCGGRGGSMHIADVETGNLGANGIVAGGIPIIKALREGLTANRIEWVAGIINGTTNFSYQTHDFMTRNHRKKRWTPLFTYLMDI